MFYVVDESDKFTGVGYEDITPAIDKWLSENNFFVLETDDSISIADSDDVDVLNMRFRDLTLEELKSLNLNRLSRLYTIKRKECLDYIADIRFTPEIDDEYTTKYNLALKAIETSDYSIFSVDAQALSLLTGNTVTPEDYCNLIISKGSQMKPTKDSVILRMGTVRVILKNLILVGEIERAKSIICDIEKMTPEMIVSATDDQIIGILTKG